MSTEVASGSRDGWVYYFTHAATFGLGMLGFFKGLVWPAMLVYAALKSLGM